MEMRFKFVPHPRMLTERMADDTLKGRIDAGCFDSELFVLAELLCETLDHEISPGTELGPRPVHAIEGEKEIFACPSQSNSLWEWLLKCKPVARVAGSTS